MRMPRSLCLVALLILGPPSARAGEGSGSTVGDLKIPSGPMVVYDYHYDHNAFADSVDLPGGLVALTRSGNLIRSDPETLKPTREWFGPSRITCMGRGEKGMALVGFEDGRVARLDPASLEFTVIATLPGKPHWVGTKAGGGAVAVVERWRWFDETVDGLGRWGFPGTREFNGEVGSRKTGIQEWQPDSEVHDLGSGRSCAIGGRASAVYLDRKHRVWFGVGYGEFGGWCRCVDLSGGQARIVRGPFDPADEKDPFSDCVHGFIELRDGRILALSGVMHGSGTINIYRVDGNQVTTLVHLEGDLVNEGFGPGKPDSPIVRMIEGREQGSLLAVSENNTVYQTDSTLKHWNEFREVKDAYAYPNARAIHVREGGLLCATPQDGYVFMTRKEMTESLVPNQLSSEAIRNIEVTSEGTFFRDVEESPWQFRGGLWRREPIELPVGGIFDPPMFSGKDGAIYSIGGRFTIRWHKGKMENLGGPLPLRGHSPFATPDSTLWSAKGEELWPVGLDRKDGAGERAPQGQLMRLVDGEWSKVADLPGAVGPNWERTEYLEDAEMLIQDLSENIRTRRTDGAGFPKPLPAEGTYPIGQGLGVINEVGPPWVIHDCGEGQLLGLDYNLEIKNIKFAALPISENGLPLKVYDAVSWSREEILIATRKGLMLYDIFARKHRPAPLPSPDRAVKMLARDGSGRLWMGGEGLWMVDPVGRLHDLAPVPMVGRSTVAALATDARRKDGVIVSLGVRGVAFVRVEAGP